MRQFDRARQNVIATAARDDADGTSGCKVDTVGPALGSDAPKLRGEICIGGDAEGHFASALRQYLPRPCPIAIVDLCPGGGNRDVVPYGVFHLNIRDNLRIVIQNDVGFDDAPADSEFLRAGEFRIQRNRINDGALETALRRKVNCTIEPCACSGERADKGARGGLPDTTGNADARKIAPHDVDREGAIARKHIGITADRTIIGQPRQCDRISPRALRDDADHIG